MMRHLFLLITLIIATAIFVAGQTNKKSNNIKKIESENISERSYFEARRVLEAAITAYGGREALRSIENYSIKFSGETVHRNQSLRPEPPYDRTPLGGLLVVDQKNGRVSHEISRTSPGGFDGHTRLVTDGKTGATLNLLEKRMTKLGNPSFSNQRERLRWLPHNILLEAVSRLAALRSLGTAGFNNRRTSS